MKWPKHKSLAVTKIMPRLCCLCDRPATTLIKFNDLDRPGDTVTLGTRSITLPTASCETCDEHVKVATINLLNSQGYEEYQTAVEFRPPAMERQY